ncbi:MAG: hypothetical protein ACK5Z5_07865 [Neisseriaceae bacterium]
MIPSDRVITKSQRCPDQKKESEFKYNPSAKIINKNNQSLLSRLQSKEAINRLITFTSTEISNIINCIRLLQEKVDIFNDEGPSYSSYYHSQFLCGEINLSKLLNTGWDYPREINKPELTKSLSELDILETTLFGNYVIKDNISEFFKNILKADSFLGNRNSLPAINSKSEKKLNLILDFLKSYKIYIANANKQSGSDDEL